jgi:uncharacterized protein (TIGR00369 family)
MSTDLLTHAREVLARQPFSVLMGAQVDAYEPGHACLRLPVRPEHLQQHGFVHGGVLSYLADNTLTYAGGSMLGSCVTAEYKINYVRPATKTTELVADATVLSSGKTQAVCRCDVFMLRDGERVLCATALGTIRKIEA